MSSAVVVGVDGLLEALEAAGVADRLAEQLGASIVLVHVVEEEAVFPYRDEVEHERRLRAATERAATLLDEVGPLRASVDRVVVYGQAPEMLARIAAERDAALVVVGSRGRGAVKAALLGSVSRALAAMADRPVVVAPAAPQRDEVRVDGDDDRAVIVCGVDDSQPSNAALAAALALAKRAGYELVLAHAADVPSPRPVIPEIGTPPVSTHHAELIEQQREAVGRLLSRAEQAASRREVNVTTRLESGDPATALQRVAAEERAALIVVGSRGHRALDAALLGSTSMALASSASRPVMIVAPGAERPLERAGGDATA